MLTGVQSQSGVVPDFAKLVAKHPAAWLLLGNAVGLTLASDIRRLSPNTVILLRAQADNWSLDAGVVDFAARSMKVAAPFLQQGLCDYLLPPNEPVVQNDVDAKRLNEQMVQIASIYKSNGFRTGAYTNPVGNPPYNLLPFLRDGILACDGLWFTHQYGAPTLQDDAPDLSLRHRKASAILAIPNLSIGILECGIDLGIVGKSGGYRALPDNGRLIEDYLAQLTWWESELAKDAYVYFTTLFGYAMEHPWETFDVAAVDTDRAAFINWMQPGSTPPPPETAMEPTPAQTVATVPFLVKASLQAKYGAGGLGNSIYGQYDATGDGGELWRCWIFLRGGLKVKDGNYADFSGVKLFNPIDGTPLDTPLPWPSGGTTPPITPPPSGIPPFAIPAMLTQYGASAVEGAVVAGLPFYRLTGATVRAGVSAFCKITVLGKNGAPLIGAWVINLRPDGGKEVLATDGSGNIQFNYGAGSAFSTPGTGPFTNGVADSNGVFLHGDKAISLGDYQATHTEWYLQFTQVQ